VGDTLALGVGVAVDAVLVGAPLEDAFVPVGALEVTPTSALAVALAATLAVVVDLVGVALGFAVCEVVGWTTGAVPTS
jgi:hypothetical protein